MVQIPVKTSSVSASVARAPALRGRPTSATGSVLGEIGKGFEAVAGILDKLQARDDANLITTAEVSLAERDTTAFLEAKRSAGEGGVGFASAYDEQYRTFSEEEAAKIEAGGGSAEAAKLFRERAEISRVRRFGESSIFEDVSRRAKHRLDATTGLGALERAARDDPASLAVLLELRTNRLAAASSVLLPAELSKLRTDTDGKMEAAAVEGFLAQGLFEEARALLAVQTNIPATTSASLAKKIEVEIEKQVVNDTLAFVERQGGFAAGYAKVLLGEFDNPDLKAAYKALPALKRLEIQSKVLNVFSERRSFLKNREDDEEKAANLLTDDLKRELTLTTDTADKIRIFGQIQRANTETPEDEEAMLKEILGTAGFSPFPNPSLEAEFMRDLQESTNVGPDDIRAAQSQLTQQEFTRVMARSRALQNTALRDSFALIDREFGLPPGNVFPTEDQVALSAALEPIKGDLQRWLEENPDASVGEIRAQRDTLVKEGRGKVKEVQDTQALEKIAILGALVPGFDITNPEESFKKLVAEGLALDVGRGRSLSVAIRAAKKRGLLK